MGRPPCCDKSNVKRGLWTAEEDAKLLAYVSNHGIGNWTLVPKRAGLSRCGKSCRLRWTNYLRPDLKHDNFTPEEEDLIINLHKAVGSRWSLIADSLPGRTDNDVKNYWNTKLKKKLSKTGIDPITHKPMSQVVSDYGNVSSIIFRPAGNQNNINSFSTIPKTNNFMPIQPEPFSPVPDECNNSNSDDMTMINTPIIDHLIIHDNNNSSFNLLSQFQSCYNYSYNYNYDDHALQSQLFNNNCEVNSACSSSSPTTMTSSPRSNHPNSSSFMWSEFIIGDDEDVNNEMLSSTNSSSLKEDAVLCSGGNEQKGKLGFDEDSNYNMENIQGKVNKGGDDDDAILVATSNAGASSFVDDILDKDIEMRLQFPELLDFCFDY